MVDEKETHFFECQCHSPEHTLNFWIDPDDGSVQTSMFLRPQGAWYKRLWIAVKYVFGYNCQYGHWDNFILKSEDHGKFRKLLNQAERTRLAYLLKCDFTADNPNSESILKNTKPEEKHQ